MFFDEQKKKNKMIIRFGNIKQYMKYFKICSDTKMLRFGDLVGRLYMS